ncbi:unnamed protein product [Ceratitis capitata]|uniref:(Mediterranean fruit fly) hypothetical protein n=1 Tax=Ceratitis capitata TaxID=7213 RepID=A0A811V810_CERCA|nr:unnamed protein product [Ceratitis capitata]
MKKIRKVNNNNQGIKRYLSPQPSNIRNKKQRKTVDLTDGDTERNDGGVFAYKRNTNDDEIKNKDSSSKDCLQLKATIAPNKSNENINWNTFVQDPGELYEQRYPVSFSTFKTMTHCLNVIKRILEDIRAATGIDFTNDELMKERVLKNFYIQFYEQPQIRNVYQLETKACPTFVKKKIMQIPTLSDESNRDTNANEAAKMTADKCSKGAAIQTIKHSKPVETNDNSLPAISNSDDLWAAGKPVELNLLKGQTPQHIDILNDTRLPLEQELIKSKNLNVADKPIEQECVEVQSSQCVNHCEATNVQSQLENLEAQSPKKEENSLPQQRVTPNACRPTKKIYISKSVAFANLDFLKAHIKRRVPDEGKQQIILERIALELLQQNKYARIGNLIKQEFAVKEKSADVDENVIDITDKSSQVALVDLSQIERVHQAKALFFQVFPKTNTLPYALRFHKGLKRHIIAAILEMSVEEFKKYTRIHDAAEIYDDAELLETLYHYTIKSNQIWPQNLYMPLNDLREYLKAKGVHIADDNLEGISPMLLHWQELSEITNFDEIVRWDYYRCKGEIFDKDMDSFGIYRKTFYEKCWLYNNWLREVPKLLITVDNISKEKDGITPMEVDEDTEGAESTNKCENNQNVESEQRMNAAPEAVAVDEIVEAITHEAHTNEMDVDHAEESINTPLAVKNAEHSNETSLAQNDEACVVANQAENVAQINVVIAEPIADTSTVHRETPNDQLTAEIFCNSTLNVEIVTENQHAMLKDAAAKQTPTSVALDETPTIISQDCKISGREIITQQRLQRAKELYFKEVEKTCTLAYLVRFHNGLKRHILQAILSMSFEEFKEYTHIYDAAEIYNDSVLLQRCYEYALKKPQVSGKKMRKNKALREPYRQKFYTKCWFYDKWLWYTPKLSTIMLSEDLMERSETVIKEESNENTVFEQSVVVHAITESERDVVESPKSKGGHDRENSAGHEHAASAIALPTNNARTVCMVDAEIQTSQRLLATLTDLQTVVPNTALRPIPEPFPLPGKAIKEEKLEPLNKLQFNLTKDEENYECVPLPDDVVDLDTSAASAQSTEQLLSPLSNSETLATQDFTSLVACESGVGRNGDKRSESPNYELNTQCNWESETLVQNAGQNEGETDEISSPPLEQEPIEGQPQTKPRRDGIVQGQNQQVELPTISPLQKPISRQVKQEIIEQQQKQAEVTKERPQKALQKIQLDAAMTRIFEANLLLQKRKQKEKQQQQQRAKKLKSAAVALKKHQQLLKNNQQQQSIENDQQQHSIEDKQQQEKSIENNKQQQSTEDKQQQEKSIENNKQQQSIENDQQQQQSMEDKKQHQSMEDKKQHQSIEDKQQQQQSIEDKQQQQSIEDKQQQQSIEDKKQQQSIENDQQQEKSIENNQQKQSIEKDQPQEKSIGNNQQKQSIEKDQQQEKSLGNNQQKQSKENEQQKQSLEKKPQQSVKTRNQRKSVENEQQQEKSIENNQQKQSKENEQQKQSLEKKPQQSIKTRHQRKSVENANQQEKSIENNQQEKSIENNQQEKSIENNQQEKSIKSDKSDQSKENEQQKQSLEKKSQQSVKTRHQRKSVENEQQQEKSIENNQPEKSIENNQQEKSIESGQQQEKSIENNQQKQSKENEQQKQSLEKKPQQSVKTRHQQRSIEKEQQQEKSIENIQPEKSIENNQQEKSIENNQQEKSIENNQQEKSIKSDQQQEKSIENVQPEKSIENNQQEKSIENNQQEKSIKSDQQQEKSIENNQQKQSKENEQQKQSLEKKSQQSVKTRHQRKSVENEQQQLQISTRQRQQNERQQLIQSSTLLQQQKQQMENSTLQEQQKEKELNQLADEQISKGQQQNEEENTQRSFEKTERTRKTGETQKIEKSQQLPVEKEGTKLNTLQQPRTQQCVQQEEKSQSHQREQTQQKQHQPTQQKHTQQAEKHQQQQQNQSYQFLSSTQQQQHVCQLVDTLQTLRCAGSEGNENTKRQQQSSEYGVQEVGITNSLQQHTHLLTEHKHPLANTTNDMLQVNICVKHTFTNTPIHSPNLVTPSLPSPKGPTRMCTPAGLKRFFCRRLEKLDYFSEVTALNIAEYQLQCSSIGQSYLQAKLRTTQLRTMVHGDIMAALLPRCTPKMIEDLQLLLQYVGEFHFDMWQQQRQRKFISKSTHRTLHTLCAHVLLLFFAYSTPFQTKCLNSVEETHCFEPGNVLSTCVAGVSANRVEQSFGELSLAVDPSILAQMAVLKRNL